MNSMKIDELIKQLEYHKEMCTRWHDENNTKTSEDGSFIGLCIAIEALYAHKAGYKMYTYDYSERDLVEAECELSKILEELER